MEAQPDTPDYGDPYLNQIAGVSPVGQDFAGRIAQLRTDLQARGVPTQVISGYRSPAQQAWLVAHPQGNPVAAPGNSFHNYGAAVDIVPASGVDYAAGNAIIGQLASDPSRGLTWGGNWSGAQHDPNHIQLGGVTLDQLRGGAPASASAYSAPAGTLGAYRQTVEQGQSGVTNNVPDLLGSWPTTSDPQGEALLKSFMKPAPGVPAASGGYSNTDSAGSPIVPGQDIIVQRHAVMADPSGEALLKSFMKPAPSAVPDLLGNWPSAGGAQATAPSNFQPSDVSHPQLLAASTGVLNGVPIVGPYLQSGVEHASAAMHTLENGMPYADNLAAIQERTRISQQANPLTTTAGNVLGGVVGTVPAMALAPGAFGAGAGGLGVNTIASGVTGAAIGGADSAIRSGGDLSSAKQGAVVGGIFGGLAPGAGKLIGAGVNALTNAASRTTPAARNVFGILQDIGLSPADANNALARMGPHATLADINPALTTEAGGLASLGGAPTSVLKGAMANRAAGADDRMSQIVNSTLGPKPDAEGILNQIRNREVSNNVDATTAKAALNNSMGPAADPQAVLSKMIATRSAAAQPLYEKALERPVAWDNRLQQFLEDPVVQSGLAKGVRIQRLESLADPNAKPFNPTDYAIKDFDAGGDPIIGTTPNMRTLNVVKKGLDSMVSDAQDPVTGRLSEEGRAIDGVRRAFLTKLDQINPDYKAARQAWAGPTQTQEAFNRGLNLFRNQSGSSGISSTPGALDAWVKDAGTSAAEKDAAKLGARTAFQQQMSNASDPAAKAAVLANKEVNQQKLASILGPTEANSLVKQLTFKYEDPVGSAFSKGLDIFKSREGAQGIGDSPDSLRNWLKNADPSEVAAHQQGARQAIEQALTSARQGDVSAARSLFAKSTANREKLEAAFPNAKKMLDGLDNELTMRSTEQRVAQNSATAERQAVQQKYAPSSEPGIGAAVPILGEAVGGGPGAAAAIGGRMLYTHARDALTRNALNRLTEGTARGLSATGPEQQEFLSQLGRAGRSGGSSNALANGSSALVNLLTRTMGPSLSRIDGANALLSHGRI